ncbi:MAG: phosphopantothenoylcysteine decarboxylase [Planctomycetaceae bacterium]
MRVLITAGPTREYLDDVRFLSNASSGRMGYAIAEACLAAGHETVLISGPVNLEPPNGCELHKVETTTDLEEACTKLFPNCDGIIAAAAVCDYRPKERATGKLKKTGGTVVLEMVETTDVLKLLGTQKRQDQWILGFALEAQDARQNAVRKLKSKNCDFIVLNHTSAIGSDSNSVEVINADGDTETAIHGRKSEIAVELVNWLTNRLQKKT